MAGLKTAADLVPDILAARATPERLTKARQIGAEDLFQQVTAGPRVAEKFGLQYLTPQEQAESQAGESKMLSFEDDITDNLKNIQSIPEAKEMFKEIIKEMRPQGIKSIHDLVPAIHEVYKRLSLGTPAIEYDAPVGAPTILPEKISLGTSDTPPARSINTIETPAQEKIGFDELGQAADTVERSLAAADRDGQIDFRNFTNPLGLVSKAGEKRRSDRAQSEFLINQMKYKQQGAQIAADKKFERDKLFKDMGIEHETKIEAMRQEGKDRRDKNKGKTKSWDSSALKEARKEIYKFSKQANVSLNRGTYIQAAAGTIKGAIAAGAGSSDVKQLIEIMGGEEVFSSRGITFDPVNPNVSPTGAGRTSRKGTKQPLVKGSASSKAQGIFDNAVSEFTGKNPANRPRRRKKLLNYYKQILRTGDQNTADEFHKTFPEVMRIEGINRKSAVKGRKGASLEEPVGDIAGGSDAQAAKSLKGKAPIVLGDEVETQFNKYAQFFNNVLADKDAAKELDPGWFDQQIEKLRLGGVPEDDIEDLTEGYKVQIEKKIAESIAVENTQGYIDSAQKKAKRAAMIKALKQQRGISDLDELYESVSFGQE